MKKNNRSFGVIGIEVKNGNFNADFTGMPQQSEGIITASPNAIKYCHREYWKSKGYDVFLQRTQKLGKAGKTVYLTLEERFLNVASLNKPSEDGAQNLIKIINHTDILNFGAVLALSEGSSSCTGPIQFNKAVNKYQDTEIIRDTVMSPFRNPKDTKEESEMTTLGARVIVSEAHLFYTFTCNPWNLEKVERLDSEFEGYTVEAYERFKEAGLNSVNYNNSVARAGCSNEFAMFVELKEGSLALKPNIADSIVCDKDEDGNILIDLKDVLVQLESIEQEIDKIEIYHNHFCTAVKNFTTDKLQDRVSVFSILNPKMKLN